MSRKWLIRTVKDIKGFLAVQAPGKNYFHIERVTYQVEFALWFSVTIKTSTMVYNIYRIYIWLCKDYMDQKTFLVYISWGPMKLNKETYWCLVMPLRQCTGPSLVHFMACHFFRDKPFLCTCRANFTESLQWRHNDHDGVSNHQPNGCLLNRLFGRRSKKTSKLRVTGLCVGNSPGPGSSPHKGPVTRKMFPFDDVIMFKSKHTSYQCYHLKKNASHAHNSSFVGFSMWLVTAWFVFII